MTGDDWASYERRRNDRLRRERAAMEAEAGRAQLEAAEAMARDRRDRNLRALETTDAQRAQMRADLSELRWQGEVTEALGRLAEADERGEQLPPAPSPEGLTADDYAALFMEAGFSDHDVARGLERMRCGSYLGWEDVAAAMLLLESSGTSPQATGGSVAAAARKLREAEATIAALRLIYGAEG